ncbi:hypothetical protein ACRAWD_17585 [Caulobacter segnis]
MGAAGRRYRGLAAPHAGRRADRLRLAGDYAGAFDTLSRGFTVAPRDPTLLAALARLYDSGDLARQAAQTHDVLLTMNPNDQDALAGSARWPCAPATMVRLAKGCCGVRSRSSRMTRNCTYQVGQMERARGHERAALKAFERAQTCWREARRRARAAPRRPGRRAGPNPFAARAIAQAVDADLWRAAAASPAAYAPAPTLAAAAHARGGRPRPTPPTRPRQRELAAA